MVGPYFLLMYSFHGVKNNFKVNVLYTAFKDRDPFSSLLFPDAQRHVELPAAELQMRIVYSKVRGGIFTEKEEQGKIMDFTLKALSLLAGFVLLERKSGRKASDTFPGSLTEQCNLLSKKKHF